MLPMQYRTETFTAAAVDACVAGRDTASVLPSGRERNDVTFLASSTRTRVRNRVKSGIIGYGLGY